MYVQRCPKRRRIHTGVEISRDLDDSCSENDFSENKNNHMIAFGSILFVIRKMILIQVRVVRPSTDLPRQITFSHTTRTTNTMIVHRHRFTKRQYRDACNKTSKLFVKISCRNTPKLDGRSIQKNVVKTHTNGSRISHKTRWCWKIKAFFAQYVSSTGMDKNYKTDNVKTINPFK